MHETQRIARFAAATALAILTLGMPAAQANDPCTSVGTALICQGDQADGIDEYDTGFESLLVNSLDGDIVTSSVAGILFGTSSGGPLTFVGDTGPFGISTTGDQAPGIYVDSSKTIIYGAPTFASADVEVLSADNVTTTGEESYGIVVDTLTALVSATQSVTSEGPDVDVASTGTVVTHGSFANGIDVFSAISAGTTASGQTAKAIGGDVTATGRDVTTYGEEATGINVRQNVSGNGSVALATGGDLTAINAGVVTTHGEYAPGIVAFNFISAAGADATATSGNITISSETIRTEGDNAAGIGAGWGFIANANTSATTLGREILVTSNDLISTQGAAATGISVTETHSASASAGPATATGGAIKVDNKGRIETHGEGAPGIWIVKDISASALSGGNAAASSGAITIDSADISTEGLFAHGIVVELSLQADTTGAGTAVGGPITINSGNVSVTGPGAAAFAVLNAVVNSGATGTTKSSDIVVNSTGTVVATGTGGIGIVAGNAAFGPGAVDGDISINVLSGSVTVGEAGVAIVLSGGNANTITNYGVISAPGGFAVGAGYGDETIENYGTLRGSIDLGPGDNAVNNRASGVLETGTLVALGAGNALTNDGILAPGGSGTIASTELSGNLVQTATGRYATDINFATGEADLIEVDGTASLAGTVIASPLAGANGSGLARQFHILSAAGGATNDGITALDTATADYSVIFDPDGQNVYLGAAIDFSPEGLSSNQISIGNVLNAIQTVGPTAGTAPLLDALLTVSTQAELAQIYNQLSPEVYGAQRVETLLAAEQFSNELMSCRVEGDARIAAIREGQCLWGRARVRDGDFSSAGSGAESNVGSFSAGVQVATAADWRVGVAVGYDLTSLSTGSGAAADGDRVNLGAVVKYNPGAALLAAGIAAGWGDFDTTRPMAFGGLAGPAESKSEVDHVSGWLHAAYLLDQGSWYLKPLVDARITQLDADGVRETGGGAALAISGEQDTLISVSPALEIGTELRLDALAVWRPFLRAGLTWRDEDALTSAATFVDAPAGIAGFDFVTAVDDVLVDVSAGVDVIATDGGALRFQYDGRFGSDTSLNSVGLKGSVPF
jgi:uncharacterized protein with beta-barrel porin domain